MANPDFFKPAFDALATDGCIGDPSGMLAYAYMRVSDSDQAEDGRSGLPRQIEHIHEAACKHGFKIPWDFVFADDYTGFDFEHRPALSKLRREYTNGQRRASAVLIEHLDRLSRNADWHQGFLLHEMSQHGIQALFWKAFSSRIERAVMGAIAQDGMEQAIARMREGTLKKAISGRVTAKVAAFGYKLVDGQGNENTMEARKDTHYAIDEAREVPVCFIYEAIAFNGMSCYELMNALDERAKVDEAFRPPRARAWNERSLVKLIRNPLYKGEFIANRFYTERVTVMDENGQSKTVRKTRQRPESEWVRVPVPPIVDEHTWEMANRNLYRNKGFARRNKKYEYMLTSIIRCDTCGWRYHGHTENKPRRIQRYYCSQIHTTPGYREHRPCGQPSIHCDVLDAAVWGVISDALLNPDVLLKAIDARYSNEQVRSTQAQIAFLEDQIEGKADEAEKLYRAYLAGAYTADEFAAERQRVTRARDVLTAEVAELRSHIMTPEQLEKEKRRTVELVQYARENVDIHDAPLTLKRQIVRLLVDEIILNVNEGWFELRGTVGAGLIFLNGDTPVVRTSTL